MSFAGGIWFLRTAFQESTQDGVLCLLVPFYSIFFLLNHLDPSLRPFLLNLAGSLILMFAICAGSLSSGPAQQAANRNAVTANPERFVAGGPIDQFAMASEAIASLDAVAGAISEIENPQTLESSITIIERETAKFRALTKKLNGATNLPKAGNRPDQIQVMQVEARSKQLGREIQNFVQRAPGLGIDQPALLRWQDAFRQFSEAVLTFAHTGQAKGL
jgi:hypothetical protein